MHLIRAAVYAANGSLPEVPIRADRRRLAKRLWRGAAEDGTEFGFEVREPLQDGDVVWATRTARYVLRQGKEALLEIPLDVSADAAAVIGWAVGNLHFPVEAQAGRLLAPDDPALRQALDRISIHYHEANEVFRPGRFTGTMAGHGHTHGSDHPHSV
ncbi:MAG: urease accessory protein UreE [Opitutaceae bacterium]